MKSQNYSSRVDWLLPMVLLLVYLLVLYPYDSISTGKIWFVILFSLFILGLLLSIQYKIEDNMLSVKTLFYSKKIPIESISKIQRSYNPLSSPAGAIKRLEITYGSPSHFVLISPSLESKFIEELTKINPAIEVDV